MNSSPPFSLLEFTGPERNDFLHRLLSNDLRLSPGQSTRAFLLNVQGRPLSYFWIFQEADRTWLVCPSQLAEASLQELDKMHFGEKLRMSDQTPNWNLTLAVGPERGQIPLPEGSLRFSIPWQASGSELLATPTPLLWDWPEVSSAWELERIQAGRGWPSDWTEKTMMLEVAEEDDYVDGKGCYPGQEVVARTLHRGHVNRHLTYLVGPASSTSTLSHEGKEVGRITSRAEQEDRLHVLAYVRREFWAIGTELVGEDGARFQVCSPRREP